MLVDFWLGIGNNRKELLTIISANDLKEEMTNPSIISSSQELSFGFLFRGCFFGKLDGFTFLVNSDFFDFSVFFPFFGP